MSDETNAKRPEYGLPGNPPQQPEPAAEGEATPLGTPASPMPSSPFGTAPQQNDYPYGQAASQAGQSSPFGQEAQFSPQTGYNAPGNQGGPNYPQSAGTPASAPAYGASPSAAQPVTGAPVPPYQGGSQQPGHWQQGYQPNQPKKRKGIKTLIAGVVCLVLAGLSLVGAFAATASLTASFASHEGQLVQVPGKLPVKTGKMYTISLPVSEAQSGGSCTVKGSNIEVNRDDALTNEALAFTPEGTNEEYVPVVNFTAAGDSEARIECGQNQQAFLHDPVNVLGGGAALIGGALGLLVFGLIGLILVIVGIVRFVRSKKHA
ncbi:hypothetical protein ACUH93_04490 [Dermabacteraceae bacterium P7006]